MPSVITADPSNSYDYHHYDIATNARIANILNGGQVEFGLPLHQLSWREYHQAFQQAVQDFVNDHALKLSSRDRCPNGNGAR